jgi:hypothetical protein
MRRTQKYSYLENTDESKENMTIGSHERRSSILLLRCEPSREISEKKQKMPLSGKLVKRLGLLSETQNFSTSLTVVRMSSGIFIIFS